jgi:3',5'-cyclic AMP phosphodiesterase CpdA
VKPVRLVLVSDTHLRHPELPQGDVLVHAGDLTQGGRRDELKRAIAWLKAQPHPHKVAIAGNHDFGLEREPELARLFEPEVHYLRDEACTVAGLRFWGAPWTPRFHDWAFNVDRGAPLRAIWERIPPGLDVLVTHGPPHGILDRTWSGLHVGCEELRRAVETKRPRLHVFGHIHEAYGAQRLGGTELVNACICDVWYRAVNAPLVRDLDVPLAATPRPTRGRASGRSS